MANKKINNNRTSSKSQTKEWTIMVYMAGDNNLSQDMITGLKGMMEVGDKANINLIALYDGSYPSAPIKIYEFSKSLLNQNNKLRLEDFAIDIKFPKTNSGKADLFKLKDFVPLVLEKYKAKKYALILSGHSDGIIGKALLRDENPNAALDLVTLRKILEDVMPGDLKGRKKKFDLLGFDGCLMSMLEVGYELKDVAKVMVASEGNIPTSGWAYEHILADIIAGTGQLDETAFAKSIVKQYANFNEDYAISGRSINISACNLDNIEPVYAAIQNFAKHLHDLLDLPTEPKYGVTEEIASVNRLVKDKFVNWMILSHYESQTFMHGQAIDIIDFIYNLLQRATKSQLICKQIYGEISENKTATEIEQKIQLFFNDFIAINKATKEKNNNYILASCFVGAEYQFSQGNSVFFPWTRMALNMVYDKYKLLEFNKTKNWMNLIDKFTNLTIRHRQELPAFDKKIQSSITLSLDTLLHKEVGGKEVGGKEVGGKGIEEFYFYFSQIRNYDPDVFSMGCVDDTNFL